MGDATGGKPRILAIDDEVDFTDMLKQYFEMRNYEIDVVSEGNKGLDLFHEKKYDIVLLDLKMVGLNGDEVMKKMKEADPDIRTIFITAFSDAGRTKTRLLEEGAFAYIEKPLSSLKDLEDLINKAMKAKNGGR